MLKYRIKDESNLFFSDFIKKDPNNNDIEE